LEPWLCLGSSFFKTVALAEIDIASLASGKVDVIECV